MKKLIGAIVVLLVMHFFALKTVISGSGISHLSGGYHVHFIGAFLIAVFLMYVLKHEFISFKHPRVFTLIYVTVLAIIFELIQIKLGRHTDYTDVLDVLFSTLGGGAYVLMIKTRIIDKLTTRR